MGRGGDPKPEHDVTGGARARTNTRASEPERTNRGAEQERERGFIYHIPPEPENSSSRELQKVTHAHGRISSKVLLRTKEILKPPLPPPNTSKPDTYQTSYKPAQFSRNSVDFKRMGLNTNKDFMITVIRKIFRILARY
jgi:hypothetical protein